MKTVKQPLAYNNDAPRRFAEWQSPSLGRAVPDRVAQEDCKVIFGSSASSKWTTTTRRAQRVYVAFVLFFSSYPLCRRGSILCFHHTVGSFSDFAVLLSRGSGVLPSSFLCLCAQIQICRKVSSSLRIVAAEIN